MDLANTLLWTVSLALAVIGIGFGVIASSNSHKANVAVKELIESSWISDESEKLFFYNLKDLLNKNTQTLSLLKTEGVTYRKYSFVAGGTRLSPITIRAKQILLETEFKDIVNHYVSTKKELELFFSNVIENFKILGTTDKIPKKKKEQLILYHKEIAKQISSIIRSYTSFLKK